MSDGAFWNPHDETDRDAMRDLLVPLIIASRCRDFIDKTMARAQTYTWCVTMRDVPREILALAIERIVGGGVTWMPKPGEVKKICHDIIAAKQAEARRGALAKCKHSGHWITTNVDGVERMKRCACWERGEQLALKVAPPIALPAATGLAPLDELAPIQIDKGE